MTLTPLVTNNLSFLTLKDWVRDSSRDRKLRLKVDTNLVSLHMFKSRKGKTKQDLKKIGQCVLFLSSLDSSCYHW